MKRIYLFFIGLLVWGGISAQRLVKVGDGYSSTSVNTTVFRNSSLVTDGGVQYISYYKCSRCTQCHQYDGRWRRLSASFF